MRNQGDLAEGWYDPETKLKADERADEEPRQQPRQPKDDAPDEEDDDDDDDEEIGPSLPTANRKSGVAIPKIQDLVLRDGM
jgi:hypothetical protein